MSVEVSNISNLVKIVNISVEMSNISINISNMLFEILHISIESYNYLFQISNILVEINHEHLGWNLKHFGQPLSFRWKSSVKILNFRLKIKRKSNISFEVLNISVETAYFG